MAGIEGERANTLDRFLDELPELSSSFLSVPVDDFFDDYVRELGAGAASTQPDNAEYAETLSYRGQSAPPLGQAMSLDLPLPAEQVPLQPVVSLPDAPGPTPFAAHATVPQPVPAVPGAQEANGKQGHSEGSGSAVWMETAGAGAAAARPRRPAARQAAYAEAADDSDEAEADAKPNKAAAARGGGKTKRNAKQQVQNKQAQQRYRERRKQRFVEMEHTIDGLNAKVAQMQAVQSQNAMLQAKREELEAMLREQQAELDRLRGQLQAGGAAGEERSAEQRRSAEEAHLRECQAQVAAHVALLREFIEAHGLRAAHPSGEGVDGGVLGRLAELVGRGCSICQSAMRAEGVKVLRLMSRDVRHLSRIACLREADRWARVLQTLQLSEAQEEQLLLMRRNHLRNLRGVYEARQQLNMRAMALMLPPAERSESGSLPGAGGQGLEKQIACMSLRGHGCAAQQSADLDECLNAVKENLRLEQKHVMELNFATMHRLLSPLQAALFLVEVHPQYCDALALANCLASVLEERGKAGDPRAALAKLDSLGSREGGGRQSPASSENRSDTCPLLQRDSADGHDSHAGLRQP